MRRLLAVLAALSPILTHAPARADDPTVAVTTAPLGHQEMKDRLKGFGTVTLAEGATSDVTFQHGGQIVRLDAQQGQKVKTGQPLVTITTDPAAALSYRNAVAAETFAESELARVKALLAQHLATNAQVAAAQKALVDAQAALANERSLGNDKSTETAAAPADGFVASIAVAVGDRIPANTVALKLSRTDRPPRVTLGLEPDAARRVTPGMDAFVTPVYGNQDVGFKGKVAGTSATLDPATHLINAWIDVEAQTPVLAVGTSVAVSVILSEHQATVVPRDAVLQDGKGAYVFSVSGGKAHRVDVKTGLQTDKLIEIMGDVPPDMRVVTVGNYELKDGMAVRDDAPPATPPARDAVKPPAPSKKAS